MRRVHLATGVDEIDGGAAGYSPEPSPESDQGRWVADICAGAAGLRHQAVEPALRTPEYALPILPTGSVSNPATLRSAICIARRCGYRSVPARLGCFRCW